MAAVAIAFKKVTICQVEYESLKLSEIILSSSTSSIKIDDNVNENASESSGSTDHDMIFAMDAMNLSDDEYPDSLQF